MLVRMGVLTPVSAPSPSLSNATCNTNTCPHGRPSMVGAKTLYTVASTSPNLTMPLGPHQEPTVPKKILARRGMPRHAAACFKLLVKGTIIFRKQHRFQKPDQNTVNHMP